MRSSGRPRYLRLAFVLAAGALAGCDLAPDYKVPDTPTPVAYKESGPWQPAVASDAFPRSDWWRAFKDPELDRFEALIDTANPDLAASVARYDQARAYAAEAGSYLFPFVSVGGSATRNRQSEERPLRSARQPNQYGANTVDLQATYEIDFWDRIHNALAAGEAAAQASAADVETVRLGLHAELANDYLALRGLDAELKLLTDTVDAYARARQLTGDRYKGKIASAIDVSRAESQLDAARALLSDATAQRALLEHAIATLIGQPASNFSLAAGAQSMEIPAVPVGIPSVLLQRRPDIAAAERRVAAANANVGVARAAFYPNISLDLAGGYQDTGSVAGLLMAPFSFWSVGPGLVLPLFEGGLRHAEEAQAYGVLDEAAAQYRSAVLTAFREVEDDLALSHHLGEEAQEEAAAATAAETTLAQSMNLYRNGAVSYLDVVVAQTDALQAERTLLDLNTRRLQASVRLNRALGGGWSAADLPTADTASTIAERTNPPIPKEAADIAPANAADRQ